VRRAGVSTSTRSARSGRSRLSGRSTIPITRMKASASELSVVAAACSRGRVGIDQPHLGAAVASHAGEGQIGADRDLPGDIDHLGDSPEVRGGRGSLPSMKPPRAAP
jgi:hypothetical protein